MAILGGGLLAVGAAGAAGADRAERSSHLSHAQQVAAKAATSAFRAQITLAGQQLSTSLVALDGELEQGGTVDPAVLARAQAAYDVVRFQVADPGAASSQGASSLASALWSPTVLAADHGELAAAAPLLTVVLGRVILSPEAVAQSAQRATAWISRSAPLVGTGSTPATPADLVATAQAAQSTIAGLVPLGRLVAPAEMARVEAAGATMVRATTSGGSVRQVVGAADVLSAGLGALAGDLAGYGKGALYQ